MEPPANFASIKPFPVQGENGRSRNQMKAWGASEADEELCRKALTEIVLLRICTHVREGKDSDPGSSRVPPVPDGCV